MLADVINTILVEAPIGGIGGDALTFCWSDNVSCCVHTRWVLLVFGIHALQGLLALSVKDSFEALSILVSFEESLDPAHMGVHKIAILSVHACLPGLWS